MNFQEYLDGIQFSLAEQLATGKARLIEFQADARSLTKGHLSGLLLFSNGSELHFREYIDTTQSDSRLMYAYHFQDETKALVFRYDNAAHRPALGSPDHKHTITGIKSSIAPMLQDVLDEIGSL